MQNSAMKLTLTLIDERVIWVENVESANLATHNLLILKQDLSPLVMISKQALTIVSSNNMVQELV